MISSPSRKPLSLHYSVLNPKALGSELMGTDRKLLKKKKKNLISLVSGYASFTLTCVSLHHEREAKGCTTWLSNSKISRNDLNEIDFLEWLTEDLWRVPIQFLFQSRVFLVNCSPQGIKRSECPCSAKIKYRVIIEKLAWKYGTIQCV